MNPPQHPWTLAGRTLKNRFVLAPVKTALHGPGGGPSEAAVRFYRRIAQGGTGLLTLEPAAVSPSGIEHPRQLRLFEDRHVATIRTLVDAVHEEGAHVAVHLNHAGCAANPTVIGGKPLAPSEVACATTGAEAEALTGSQVTQLLDDFGTAAARAVRTGTDFLELQMGHGYLVHQFLSRRTNRRTDGWGDPERFARAVLDSVLGGAGSTPVLVRISGHEFLEGGLDPQAQAWLLEVLEGLGIAAVHVGFGNACDNPAWYFGHMALPEQPQIEVFEAIRHLTALPIIGTGRLGHPARLAAVFERGLIDAVGLARPLLADPDLPRKWIEGEPDRILQCGACLQACLSRVRSGRPIACMANPWVTTPDAPPAAHPRRVMVVGAGPAGIGAAVTAARRGHDVVLFEQHDVVGGQLAFAVRPQGKTSMSRVLDGMRMRLAHSGVRVRLDERVTADTVEQEHPDVLVVATGARPSLPDIGGLDRQYVVTSYEYFEGVKPIRGDRVLVIGAGMVGVEVAEMVAAMGKSVVACRRSSVIGADMDPISRKLTLNRILADKRIHLMPDTRIVAFTPEGVDAVVAGEEVRMAPFDTVIVCSGTVPDRALAEQAAGLAPEILVIGDASEPANVESAFAQGIAAGQGL